MTDATLLERWVRASHVLRGVGPDLLGGHLTYQAQACGRLDVKLRPLDRHYGSWRSLDGAVDPTLSDYMDLSRLWVMDAYELVRTLDECMRLGMWIPPAGIAEELTPLKRALEEVRIPLAKYQRARSARPRPGDVFPEPRMFAIDGAGWDVGGATRRVVGRQALAETLLTTLEAGIT